jgi:nitroreductase
LWDTGARSLLRAPVGTRGRGQTSGLAAFGEPLVGAKQPPTVADATAAAAAAENILIAAESLNIGACWVGGIVYPFDSEIGRKTRAAMKIPEARGPDAVKIETSLKEAMGIPPGYSPVAAIAIEYSAEETTRLTPRKKDVITYVR